MRACVRLSARCIFVLVLAGCGNSPTSTATSRNHPTFKPDRALPTDSSQSAAKKSEPTHELIADITSPALIAAFESAHHLATKNPTDVNAQAQYINVLQQIGVERVASGNFDKGYDTFAAAGSAAHDLIESTSHVSANFHTVLATAFYKEACVFSRRNDVKQALASLDESLKWGFSDWNLLDHDQDLATVRATADFAVHRQRWKQAIRERFRQQAKSELASASSFQFDFHLADVDGKPIKLTDYRGKILIVAIWGTWVPPCRAQVPAFIQLQQKFADKGLQVIGLNQEQGTPEEVVKTIKSFMQEQGMNYPCAVLDDTTLKQVPDFQGFPTTLLIDRSGKVRLKVIGLHEYDYLEAVVSILLDEPVEDQNK